MRHLKAGKRLGVTTSHRKAMMRNLVTSLLEHGEIKTTVTRAKEMRKYFDKMIGLGKRNDLHAKRQALSFIKSKEAFEKLFEEYGPLYADRNGGYTRIFKIGHRLGDNAKMALIQMVDLDEKGKDDTSVTKDKIEEIKEELQEEKSVEKVEVAADEPETVEAQEGTDGEVVAAESEETVADAESEEATADEKPEEEKEK